MEDQILDNMDIERERASPSRPAPSLMNYTAGDGKVRVQLSSTPWPLRTSLTKSAAASPPARALSSVVDATHFGGSRPRQYPWRWNTTSELAPILNKIDLASAHRDEVAAEAWRTSSVWRLASTRPASLAKTGLNIDQVLERVVSGHPCPCNL